MTRGTAARWVLTAFTVLAVVHLGALLAGSGVAQLTKPALMPVLAVHTAVRGGPRLLTAALLFGCGGDTLLQIGGEPAFLAGMASFAAGHVCYLVLFVRRGRAPGSRSTGRLATVVAAAWLPYAVAWLGTVALLRPDLPADLRVPVAGYSLLLTAMAYGALRAGPRAALGGLLFLGSDTLIASGLAHWPQPPAPQFCIMLSYLAAQWLLTDGTLRNLGTARTEPAAVGRPGPAAAPAGVPSDGRSSG